MFHGVCVVLLYVVCDYMMSDTDIGWLLLQHVWLRDVCGAIALFVCFLFCVVVG